MTLEIKCPDCHGYGHQADIEGDNYKGEVECKRCSGFGWIDLELDDCTIHDILCELVDENHTSILKRV